MPPSRKEIKQQELEKQLIGKTKKEVLEIMGEPAKKDGNEWEYHEELGPGAHSFQLFITIEFSDERVIRIIIEDRGIGCVIIPE